MFIAFKDALFKLKKLDASFMERTHEHKVERKESFKAAADPEMELEHSAGVQVSPPTLQLKTSEHEEQQEEFLNDHGDKGLDFDIADYKKHSENRITSPVELANFEVPQAVDASAVAQKEENHQEDHEEGYQNLKDNFLIASAVEEPPDDDEGQNNNDHFAPAFQLKKEIIQRKESASPVSYKPSTNNSNGLPDDLRSNMEQMSGYDLGDVTVQRNSQEPAQMNALAYAQGTDIHLGPGQEQHLPHEAWHVVQQKQGRVQPTTQMKGANVNDDPKLEREADLMGSKALQRKASHFNIQQSNSSENQKSVIQNKGHGKGCSCKNCSSSKQFKLEEKLDHSSAYSQISNDSIQMKGHSKGCNCPGCSKQLKKDNSTSVNTTKTESKSSPLQFRRLPDSCNGNHLTNPNATADMEGARRLMAQAEADLAPEELVEVDERQLQRPIPQVEMTPLEFWSLPEDEQINRRMRAIREVAPRLQLGDPLLIDSGPRDAADRTNIQSLVTSATAIYDAIAAGTHDTDLEQIFGLPHVAAAKAKYRQGKIWMNNLHTRDRIVTDRSGYNDEVNLGGLTGFHAQISLSPHTIDNPSDGESKVTFIHESMHAGNNSVGDEGYLGTPGFETMTAPDKLNNAAHFEVVPRRILSIAGSYAGQTFVPAGTTVTSSTGVVTTAAAQTDMEKAIKNVSDMYEDSWTTGLNLHTIFVDIYRDASIWDDNPNPWNYAVAYADCMTYWSKVLKMTIHEKTIDISSANPNEHPVSQIDIALSEHVTRKLSLGRTPETEAQAVTYLNRHNSAAVVGAATTVDQMTELLMRTLLEHHLGTITGTVDRDYRMIQEMIKEFETNVFVARSPADFAD